MRPSFFKNVRQRRLVVIYRRFESTYLFHFQGTGCLETLVNNYQRVLHNIPEERRSYGILPCIPLFGLVSYVQKIIGDYNGGFRRNRSVTNDKVGVHWDDGSVICGLLESLSRSHWPRGRRCRSAAARLLRLWVRIPSSHGCCECYVLSGRGLFVELITRPEDYTDCDTSLSVI